jgi:hypothetical protein
VKLSSPVTSGYAGDGAGHRNGPNLHQTLQNVYHSLRFFTRNPNVQMVFKGSSQKIKDEENKVQKQKFKKHDSGQIETN